MTDLVFEEEWLYRVPLGRFGSESRLVITIMKANKILAIDVECVTAVWLGLGLIDEPAEDGEEGLVVRDEAGVSRDKENETFLAIFVVLVV